MVVSLECRVFCGHWGREELTFLKEPATLIGDAFHTDFNSGTTLLSVKADIFYDVLDLQVVRSAREKIHDRQTYHHPSSKRRIPGPAGSLPPLKPGEPIPSDSLVIQHTFRDRGGALRFSEKHPPSLTLSVRLGVHAVRTVLETCAFSILSIL
jgi:hypothetical protein